MVPRVESPDRETFAQTYIARNQPVIITGAMSSWRALTAWNLRYLRAVLGDATLRMYSSPDGVFRADPQRGFDESLWRSSTALKYFDWIDADDRSPHLLLPNQSLIAKFPRLAADIAIPPYIAIRKLNDVNLWVGAGGNVTPLHCDQYDNCLAQVIGQKRILLASPRQRRYLYPHDPFDDIPPVTSRVDIEAPDLTRFPRFKRAEFIEATIAPGEILFIPVHWWHQVYGIGVNVAVNFWWEAEQRNLWKHPSYMLTMCLHNARRAMRPARQRRRPIPSTKAHESAE